MTFANWVAVLSQGNLPGFFVNSAVVAAATVVLTLICVIGLSYAISRLKIRGGQVILLVVVSALLLPLASLLIPITMLLEMLGLTNNYLGLIGPETALGIPFGTRDREGGDGRYPRGAGGGGRDRWRRQLRRADADRRAADPAVADRRRHLAVSLFVERILPGPGDHDPGPGEDACRWRRSTTRARS